jgi:hypothetical protein
MSVLILAGPGDGVCVCRDQDTGEVLVVELVKWRECHAEIERELKDRDQGWECFYRRSRDDP